MNTRFGLAISAVVALGSVSANAEVYGGIGLGGSDHAVSGESDSGVTVFAAIRLTDRVLLEGGPVWPGRVRLAEPSVVGFSVQGVGLFPLTERFEFLAKAGFYDWEMNRDGEKLYEGRDPVFGIGVQRYLNDDLALRFELSRFTDVRQGDMDWISFSVVRWFRNVPR